MTAPKYDELVKLIEVVETGKRPWREPRDPDDHPHDAFILLAFEGSVDAALALHAALLPGWWLQISGPTAGGDWMVNFAGHDSAFAPTPARALLLATLKAYRATLTPTASHKSE